MTFDAFHNGLRILHSVDADEFRGAIRECEGGASLTLPGAFQRFVADPPRFFLRADDQSAMALWRIIERRQRKPAKSSDPKADALTAARSFVANELDVRLTSYGGGAPDEDDEYITDAQTVLAKIDAALQPGALDV